jgi:hypothetical protein
MFETLQKAVHHVRTAYGISNRHYAGASREVPVQGLGQGNGDGLAGWAAISAPLIKMLLEAGFGVAICTAISDTQLRFASYSFVDDTDLPQTATNVNTSALDTLPLTQEGVDTWEGGLKATGGALVPNKSHWYLIDFVWKNNEWKYVLTANVVPADLSI